MATTRRRAFAVAAACAALLAAPLLGCMGAKAGDTTRIVQAQTAGEAAGSYAEIPGELTGEPGLAGKTLKVSVPGKDLQARGWFENGQMRWEVVTKRTAVLDAMWAGANTADAAKFAKDMWSEQHAADMALELVDRVTAFLGKYMPQPNAAATSQPAQPKLLDQLKAELLGFLQPQIDQLKAELAKRNPS